MTIFRIHLDSNNWFTPEQVALMPEHFGQTIDFDPRTEDHTQKEGAEPPKDYVLESIKKSQDKYDSGHRKVAWSHREVIVSEEHLRFYLPCVVAAILRPTSVSELRAVQMTPMMNERVKVVVPGPALLEYDQVEVHNDCCTDHIQTQLHEGWRILAISVQPDQRRPDYILGRNSRQVEA